MERNSADHIVVLDYGTGRRRYTCYTCGPEGTVTLVKHDWMDGKPEVFEEKFREFQTVHPGEPLTWEAYLRVRSQQ